jgi:exosortase/archaeosortase family protein
VEVTLACSGADALALCFAAIAAYPAGWRSRAAGMAGGAGMILVLNTMRIGTLGRAAAFPRWFDALHLYVWPALLTLAIAGYVFAWIRVVDRQHTAGPPQVLPRGPSLPGASQSWRRFAVLTLAFLLVFSVASPLYLESAGILAVAAFIARAAGGILAGAGVSAHTEGNVLWTSTGGYLVTQECIVTPLIPVYLAAVCVYAATWRRLAAGALAAVPIFIVLGIVRLLVVALPEAIAAPMFLVHAFYQLLLAAVAVYGAALWRHGSRRALPHAMAGIALGMLFVLAVGPFFERLVTLPSAVPLDDPQGAIAFLPPFQFGLYLAVWIAAFTAVGWWRFLAGFGVLALTQAAGLVILQVLSTQAGLAANVRDVRGWAIAAPLLIVAAVVSSAGARR